MARTYTGPIYDGDGHVLENKEGILAQLPREMQASRAVDRMRRRNVFPELDNYHNLLSISPEGSFSNPEQAKGWSRFMDELSIGGAVLYPTDALAVGRMVDLDQIEMATRAYNDWMHQEYLQKDGRLQAVALLPMQEPELAVLELRRAVEELGMCGGMLPATGLLKRRTLHNDACRSRSRQTALSEVDSHRHRPLRPRRPEWLYMPAVFRSRSGDDGSTCEGNLSGGLYLDGAVRHWQIKLGDCLERSVERKAGGQRGRRGYSWRTDCRRNLGRLAAA